MTLKPLRGNFDTVSVDAVGIRFESIVNNETGQKLSSSQTGEKLVVKLDKVYDAAATIILKFKYTAKPQKGIYFVDAAGNRTSQVWTQGEPEEARHWFPAYDFPDDKATTEQYLTVGKDETAIANGELVETIDNPDGTRTFHYKMPIQHSTYLTSFVVGKYSKIEDKYNSIPLAYYVYPGMENSGKRAFGKTPEMLKIFEQATGVQFPYNKYDQTIVADFQFGGMENITATTMADTEILLTPPDNVIDLVSHELAHSWFGNLVTCKSWSELWLNEGFATFMEAYYRQKVNGDTDYLRKIQTDAQTYMGTELINANSHGLFFKEAKGDEELFGFSNAPIAYQKGGVVLHMLRETVGDAAFWKGVNLYLTRHKFANVESSDLQKAMEEASGQNLNQFFRQWVYQAGFPQLEITHSYDARAKTLTVTAVQKQRTAKPTDQAFQLPLEIEIVASNRVVPQKLNVRQKVQTFKFPLASAPQKIVVDKNLRIPLKTVKLIAAK